MDEVGQQQQWQRLSARDARGLLGLPAVAPAQRPTRSSPTNEHLSVSVASSSADSADAAGGRGSLTALWRDNTTTRALGWEPAPPPTPPLSTMGSSSNNLDDTFVAKRPLHSSYDDVSDDSSTRGVIGWRGSAGDRENGTGGLVGRGEVPGGGGYLPPKTDPFWAPVLPETAPAIRFAVRRQRQDFTSERLILNDRPNNISHAYPYRPGTVREGTGGWGSGIDRPGLRGQEYRRERSRGRGRLASSSTSSSLASTGRISDGAGDGQQQQHRPADARNTYTTTLRRRSFLGIRWPLFPGGRRGSAGRGDGGGRGRSASTGDDYYPGRGANITDSTVAASHFGKGGRLAKEVFDVRAWSAAKEEGLLPSGGAVLQTRFPENVGPGEESSREGRLHVSIEGTTELGKGLGGHTAYRIQVTDEAIGEQWTVLRRYRQFEALHRSLLPVLSKEPDANAYALPPKEVFGGRHGGVIAKRLRLLKVYLDRLVTCRAAIEHRVMASFLELDPSLRGLGAYARQHGPDCVIKEGRLRVKEWKGPHKAVINILEAGLHLIGWVSSYAIVSPGPVFLVYRGKEDDPEKPIWTLPDRRTIGVQLRVRRVDMWLSDLDRDKSRFFLVSWENTSLLCQVDSESALKSWAQAIDEDVDLRQQQSEQDRAKVDIELKAKEAWTTREEGLWGGL